jgi:putative phage-type endonuclease
MNPEDLIQGTDAWQQIRVGRVTASRVADVVARTKTGWGAMRANYMTELITEKITGEPAPHYTNAAMQWGTDHQPMAQAAYEFRNNCEIVSVGFVLHPTIIDSGSSPDGLVGDDGLVEFKCPNTTTHIDYWLSDGVPGNYHTQIQYQLACTGRKWCDWVSFDPRLPEYLKLCVRRVKRDDEVIEKLENDVRKFLAEMSDKLARLTAKLEKAAA